MGILQDLKGIGSQFKVVGSKLGSGLSKGGSMLSKHSAGWSKIANGNLNPSNWLKTKDEKFESFSSSGGYTKAKRKIKKDIKDSFQLAKIAIKKIEDDIKAKAKFDPAQPSELIDKYFNEIPLFKGMDKVVDKKLMIATLASTNSSAIKLSENIFTRLANSAERTVPSISVIQDNFICPTGGDGSLLSSIDSNENFYNLLNDSNPSQSEPILFADLKSGRAQRDATNVTNQDTAQNNEHTTDLSDTPTPEDSNPGAPRERVTRNNGSVLGVSPGVAGNMEKSQAELDHELKMEAVRQGMEIVSSPDGSFKLVPQAKPQLNGDEQVNLAGVDKNGKAYRSSLLTAQIKNDRGMAKRKNGGLVATRGPKARSNVGQKM